MRAGSILEGFSHPPLSWKQLLPVSLLLLFMSRRWDVLYCFMAIRVEYTKLYYTIQYSIYYYTMLYTVLTIYYTTISDPGCAGGPLRDKLLRVPAPARVLQGGK